MRAKACLFLIGMTTFAVAACDDPDEVISPGENTRVEVSSDPAGASIFLDGANTGRLTTDVLRDLTIGKHEIVVQMPGPGRFYGYRAEVEVKGDSLHRVNGPLTMLCGTDCVTATRQYRQLNSIRASTIPNGALFFFDESEKGLIWPAGASAGYAAIGTPMIAGVAGTRDTLAFGIYNVNFMAGRPSPQVTQATDRFTLLQSYWVVPSEIIRFSPGQPAIRGIEVQEELIGTSAQQDVAFIKLTFTNITNNPSYQTLDPFLPTAGVTYTWVYIGFALDAEVGAPDDDAVTYDAALDMVYMYDMDFLDVVFPAGMTDRPGLIGLRVVEAPAGATVKALNAWPRGSDWVAGEPSTEKSGWYHFSGTRARQELAPFDIAGQHIGYAPNTTGDYRMSVSAGPLTLAPGQSASITVAVILAAPVAGSYQSGVAVPPENPTVSGRPIEAIAKDLLDKARALAVPN
jgi:hypothetical protein